MTDGYIDLVERSQRVSSSDQVLRTDSSLSNKNVDCANRHLATSNRERKGEEGGLLFGKHLLWSGSKMSIIGRSVLRSHPTYID